MIRYRNLQSTKIHILQHTYVEDGENQTVTSEILIGMSVTRQKQLLVQGKKDRMREDGGCVTAPE